MTNTLSSLDLAFAEAITKVSGSSGKLWDATATTIGKAVEVVQAEAPLVVQEFLTWKAIEAGFPLVAALIFVGVLVYFAIRGISKKWMESSDGMSVTMTVMTGILAVFFFSIAVLPNAIELAKIKYAPRVYLVEYVATTLKGK